MSWLSRLFSRCDHQWEPVETIQRRSHYGRVIGYLYVLRCKKCGDIKTKRV